MKRLIAVLLLLLYINSYTEFHEAFRLPVLLEHFAEHKQQVNDLSFWEFLTMHYKTDVSHDDQDNRLPFKDPCHSFSSAVVVLPAHKIALKEKSALTAVNHTSFYAEAYIASPGNDIFQPPRIS